MRIRSRAECIIWQLTRGYANSIAKKKNNSGSQSRTSEERYQTEKLSHTKVVLSQSIVVIILLFRGFSRSEREHGNIFECENRLGPCPSTRMVHNSTGISICQRNVSNGHRRQRECRLSGSFFPGIALGGTNAAHRTRVGLGLKFSSGCLFREVAAMGPVTLQILMEGERK